VLDYSTTPARVDHQLAAAAVAQVEREASVTIAEQEAARSHERRTMVGTGDRSAKIRTYNYPQSRVTDHRINLSVHNLSDVMNGHLDELVDALRMASRQEQLDA